MTERNIHEELLAELKQEKPQIEGFEYLSEDIIGNLVYSNDGKDGRPLGVEYIILLGGDIEKQQQLKFQTGNPKEDQNGITIENLIDISIDRITKLNANIPHWHNNLAIDGLALAANALNKRHIDRTKAGVLNTDQPLPNVGEKVDHPVVRRLLTNQDKLNFILTMYAALSQSYNDIIDTKVQDEFLEHTPEGPKRRFALTATEDEAVTLAVANTQKILAVLEQEPLFQTIFGTIVHGKKLQASNASTDTTPTSETEEAPSSSTQDAT